MSDTFPSLDLTLPSHAPELLKDYHKKCTFDEASVAIYSLVPDMTFERVQQIASMPQQEWEDYEMETQLVRPAKPTPIFAGGKLVDIVHAHAAMDKEVSPPRSSGTSDIGWLPHCFVVITNNNLDDHGLLFVYADKITDEDGNFAPMGKFFFKPEKMFTMLSGLILGGPEFPLMKRYHDLDEKKD